MKKALSTLGLTLVGWYIFHHIILFAIFRPSLGEWIKLFILASMTFNLPLLAGGIMLLFTNKKDNNTRMFLMNICYLFPIAIVCLGLGISKLSFIFLFLTTCTVLLIIMLSKKERRLNGVIISLLLSINFMLDISCYFIS